MKKLLALSLALIMTLAMFACTETKDDAKTTAPTKATTTPTTNGNGGDGDPTTPTTPAVKEHTIEQFALEFLELEWSGKSELVKGSLPQEVWDWYESEHGMTYEAALSGYEKYSGLVKESNERDYGANYHFTFTIDKISPLPADFTVEEIANALATTHDGVDASKVTDIKELVLTATQSGDSGSLTGTFGLSVVQYDGRWYGVVYSRNSFGVFANFSSRGAG